MMELETLIAELFARPLSEFTPSRNSKAKELKAAGRADIAVQLSALRKPSAHLWAVNRLSDQPAILHRLQQARQAVVKAQTDRTPNAAADLRSASEEFQRALEVAGDEAGDVLQRHDHSAGEEVLRRVREILRVAVLRGDETWELLEKGALTMEPSPGEEDVLGMFGASEGPTADSLADRANARRAMEQVQRAARTDAERAEQALALARKLRQEATEKAAAAALAAERATAAEDEASRAQAQAQESQHEMERLGTDH